MKVLEAAPAGVKLQWAAPKSEEQAPVTGYSVEQKPKGAKTWKPVGKTTDLELATSKLPEGVYDFRVIAENKVGPSEPAEIKNIDVKPKLGA